MSLLEIRNVSKTYTTVGQLPHTALKDVSLIINRGEILSLLGVNGAGKSTLANIIATLHPPTTGDIFYEGVSIYTDVPEYRMNIGLCPQYPNLNQNLTVEQNLYYTALAYRMEHTHAVDRARELLVAFDLTAYAQHTPLTLSGGYKQRVLLARTMLHKPSLVLLDEPTVGLDPHVRHELWKYMRSLRDMGTSMILTTHYIEEAEALSDRVCVLDKGIIKLTGTPESLKADYAKTNLESVFLELTKKEEGV